MPKMLNHQNNNLNHVIKTEILLIFATITLST